MISVCMATYNGEKYIKDQISSILSEISDEDELIISDDGSIDRTCEIIESFQDKRIKLFHNSSNHGVNGNFENALRHSNGDYIFLSDQDDVWISGKVEVCMKALKNNCCVVHDAIITDSNLRPEYSFFKSRKCKSGFFHNWLRNGYLGCTMAFHREILNFALPIPPNLPVWHDIWIGSICEIKHNVKFVPFKGIKFRRHNSTTSITFKGSFTLHKKISYRMILLWHLFKRLNLHR